MYTRPIHIFMPFYYVLSRLFLYVYTYACRSEWHRYNLNRKMKGLPIVSSDTDFAALTLRELEANRIGP